MKEAEIKKLQSQYQSKLNEFNSTQQGLQQEFKLLTKYEYNF
jgi:hypothetical protein